MWEKSLRIFRNLLAEEDGATVVETSVILPMIWIMIMGSILLFFFFFDMGVLRSETIGCAQEVSREWREEGEKSISRQKALLTGRINDRLILANLTSSSVSVSLTAVTVRADIRFFLGGKGLTFSDTAKVAVDNREDWIRLLASGKE